MKAMGGIFDNPEFELEVVAVYTVDDDGWTSMLVFDPTMTPLDGTIKGYRPASCVGLS